MYKGSRKQVMVIKGTGGIFDEAHFIVNDNNGNRVSEDDMVKEANRIIAEYRSCGIGGTEGKGRRANRGSTFWYISGLVSGFLGVLCCLLVISAIL